MQPPQPGPLAAASFPPPGSRSQPVHQPQPFLQQAQTLQPQRQAHTAQPFLHQAQTLQPLRPVPAGGYGGVAAGPSSAPTTPPSYLPPQPAAQGGGSAYSSLAGGAPYPGAFAPAPQPQPQPQPGPAGYFQQAPLQQQAPLGMFGLPLQDEGAYDSSPPPAC